MEFRALRVLLVEDNVRLIQAITVSLQEQGYSVDVTESAAHADELAIVEHFDLIVMDVLLPDRSGLELCRDLRRRRVTTPIVLLAPPGPTEETVRGLDAGADDYLVKPFQFSELLARLRSLLRRSMASEGATLVCGDLHMDLLQRRVWRSGEFIRLSAKEFALLELMMRSPGRLLTRTMISESVWDMNHDSRSNVIDVYVSALRRKLDTGSRHSHIETVIGSGYRFVDVLTEDGLQRGVSSAS